MKFGKLRDAPKYPRASPPGLYRCPNCGEVLSGPARFYSCPGRPVGIEQPDRLHVEFVPDLELAA